MVELLELSYCFMYNQVEQRVLNSTYRAHLYTCFKVFGKTSVFSYMTLTGSFVVITETKPVYSVVQTESLYTIQLILFIFLLLYRAF